MTQSNKLPLSGIMVSGEISELAAWKKRIVSTPTDWPTPTVQDSENNGGAAQFARNSLPLNAKVKLWPTPMARLGRQRGPQAKRYADPYRANELDDAVAFYGPSDAPTGAPKRLWPLLPQGMERAEQETAADKVRQILEL